jgi:hypothetical protein
MLIRVLGSITGIIGGLLLRVAYVTLKRTTWRQHKSAYAVARLLLLDYGWFTVDNAPAAAFVHHVETMLAACFSEWAPESDASEPLSDEKLKAFADALREALGKRLEPRPLLGVGGMPTCQGVPLLGRMHIPRAETLGEPELLAAVQRLMDQKAAAAGSSDRLDVPLMSVSEREQ